MFYIAGPGPGSKVAIHLTCPTNEMSGAVTIGQTSVGQATFDQIQEYNRYHPYIKYSTLKVLLF